jgi:acetylornithine deacetylase/succinyl-diaminopimelate desuccinylase-like protein
MSKDLAAKVDAVIPQTLEDLKTFIAIPSVSSLPDHRADVQRTAEQIVAWLKDLDCPEVQIVEEGGMPAVIAHFPAPAGKPTVCLYAHHDVQPIGNPDEWTSAAFEAEVRNGRLYGRGAADDKGGVLAHFAALRAFDGKPPVGVKLFIEGEEEIGSGSLATIIERHHEALKADAFVIADSGNWEVGAPAFTTTLRGLADCVVEVSVLDHGIHSGEYGGLVPDALMVLCRMLASLHDDEGNVAVPGLVRKPGPDLEYPLDRLREETGALDGVEWIGHGPMVERMWTAPSISILAIDATPVTHASNTLLPRARAKVSMRLAPGQNPKEALAALDAHLKANVPWGAHVEILDGDTGAPGVIPFEGPIADAAFAAVKESWGVDPVFIGQGGSIPMTAEFQDAFPGATVLVTAVTDPTSRMHSTDESLDLGDWRNAALAEALLMEKLAS